MSVRIFDNTTSLIALFNNQTDLATEIAGRDMLSKARPNTPADKGTLRQRSYVRRKGNAKTEVIWDQPYAAYQERGSRSDGTRKVRKYTTSGTGPKYAENAANEVNDPLKYLRKAGL